MLYKHLPDKIILNYKREFNFDDFLLFCRNENWLEFSSFLNELLISINWHYFIYLTDFLSNNIKNDKTQFHCHSV